MSQSIKYLRANLNFPVHKASDSPKRDSETSNPTRTTQLFDNRRVVTVKDSSTSFNTGSTVNSFSTEGPLKEEVAQRYRQILLKDYELRNMPPYLQRKKLPFQDGGLLSNAKPSIQDQKKISSEVNELTEYVISFKGQPLRENLLLDIVDEEDENFPKIVNVFSLKSPSPTKEGQNHMTTKSSLTKLGTTSAPKENGISDKDRLGTTCSITSDVVTNQRGVPIPAEDISEQKDAVMKVKPRTTSSDCVNLTRDEGIVVTTSLTTGDTGVRFRDIGGGSDRSKSAHAAVEQSVDDAEENQCKNSESHKRRNVFGFKKQNKRSCKRDRTGTDKELNHCQSRDCDINYVGWDDVHQQQGCSDIDDELDSPKVKRICSKGSSKDVTHGRIKDLNNNASEKMCENISSSNEANSSNETSNSRSDNPLMSFASYVPTNTIRETKILDLKARLAKQEEEILKLKCRKNVNKTDEEQSFHLSERCSAAAETAPNFGDWRGCSERCYRKFESNHSKNDSEDDDGSPARIDEELNLECDDLDGLDCSDAGRFEELKGIYHHVIKSFHILNARLGKSVNCTGEGYSGQRSHSVDQTKRWLVRHSIDKVELETAHVDDKDSFLSKLGLLRISSDSC